MTDALHVLVLADRDRDAQLLLAELRRGGFDPTWNRVDTEAAYLAGLDSRPDVILADRRLSRFDVPRALQHLRAAGLDIPLIVVSDTSGDEQAASLIEKGAADCVPRDGLERLVRAVTAARESKALRDLRESEERTRLILANALDAVVTIDIDGRIINWTGQAERLFGWPAAEVLHRRLSETIIPAAFREAHERGLARFRETGEGPALNRRMELSAVRRDGTEFPVELAITPVRLAGSTIFSAFLRDISDLKRAGETRRQSEASFRLLFASNPLPMWVYDAATLDFLEVNDAAVAHYGYSREEFLRMRITDIRPPEDVARLAAAVAGFGAAPAAALRRHGGAWRHRLKDGRIRAVDVASHSLEFAGRPAALVVAVDVTELKQAETALAKYAERLKVLHEIDQAIIAAEAPAAIAEAVLRPLRDLLGVPRAIVNMFDLEAGEVEWLAAVGRHRLRLGPGVRFPLALMGDVDALRRGEPQVIDVDAQPRGPEVEALLASGVHVYMVVPMIAGGELIGGVSFGGESGQFSPEQIAIAREVAATLAIAIAQARLYERVKRQAEELEQRVQERTRELRVANEQLQQEIAERRRAEAEADRANRAKSDFLSRMSHELRTPLNGIIGFAQLLELDVHGPTERESVQHILKGGRHLLALINEVLDIARIEAGNLSISPEPVLVSDVVRGALDLVRPQAAARGIRLADTVTGDRYVTADRQRLQQVLLNLLSNAVKYNREGGGVTVSCEERSERRVRLGVTDTGSGIAPEMLERLFTPFDRLGAERGDTEGTGLGLALSRRLVEAMGGRLLVDSRPGGTTFTVELSATDGPVIPTQVDTTSSQTETPTTHGTVLYIEDNVANLRLLERILSRRPGVTLVSAMQGSQGLELARAHRPDVIILDLHLPDISGDEVLVRLRDDRRTREIPVVILSADATPGQVTRLLARGARAYVTKPLEVSRLLALLDEIFGERGR
jgi:PAS domain S-box-containing protein